MEWIRISTHKLKIMLSAEDARRYALDCAKVDYADVMTRDAFREILTDLQKETDFKTDEDKLYIQMYPSKEGGCELFVTRMGLAYNESRIAEKSSAPKEFKNQKSPLTVRKKAVAFLFSELEHLLALCRRVGDAYGGESEIWQDEKNGWWLILTESGNSSGAREDLRFIREYARMENAETARLLLSEHGKLLCSANAIQIFSRF